MSRGLFITVEGTEGVGKSTNIAFLHECLREHGVDVTLTREPGGTALGEEIRNALLAQRAERVSDTTELLMIFAARAQHIEEVIAPALEAGHWVLCDRFTDATYAYQGGGRGVDNQVIARLEALVQGDLRPDTTVLLDVDVAVGMERARGRGALDRIEQETLTFFERVRATYLDRALSNPARYTIVDAQQPLPCVQEQLHAACMEWLERCQGIVQ